MPDNVISIDQLEHERRKRHALRVVLTVIDNLSSGLKEAVAKYGENSGEVNMLTSQASRMQRQRDRILSDDENAIGSVLPEQMAWLYGFPLRDKDAKE